MKKIAITVDLEFLEETHYPPESKVETAEHERKAVQEFLDLLDQNNQEITFFTVANLCDNHLDLLKDIRDRGHEIASHSYTHPNLNQLSEKELRHEIMGSKERLEKDLDIEVKGFRAPELKTSEKVLREIEKAGYTYDSSTMASLNIPGWYGGEKNFRPYQRGEITEIPLSANPITRTPISGFFIRFLGERHLRWSIRMLQHADIVPVLYLHPYEMVEFEGKKNWRQRWNAGSNFIEILEHILDSQEAARLDTLV